MFNIRKNKKGFTLVELIVVIAILAILAGTAAGVGVSIINNNANKTAQSEADTLQKELRTHMLDNIEFAYEDVDSLLEASGELTTFKAGYDRDKDQENKIIFFLKKAPAADKNAFKTDLSSNDKIPADATANIKDVTAGNHHFVAYVEEVAAGTDPVTPATFKVTFVCAMRGKTELIKATYEYTNLTE